MEGSELNDTWGSNMTDEQTHYLNLVGHGIIVPAICFAGMVLNLINFVVLRDRRLKESSYTYLVGLAIADFLSLLMFGINGIGRGHFPGQYHWRMFETNVYFPVCLTATSASVFLIVTVTAERFVFLYWPIQSRTWCTRSMARKIVTGVWAFSVVLNIPRFFVLKVTKNGEIESTAFGNSKPYNVLTWIYFVLVAIGSGISLIVFNVLLIKGIHNANQRRLSMKSTAKGEAERREELRLTRTLVSVIFLYLIGEIPSSIFSRIVFSAILGEENQHLMKELWYSICVCIATIFAVSQHSLNFVFYCVFNKRFYQIFRTKCLTCLSQHESAPIHSEIATVVENSNEQLPKANGAPKHCTSNIELKPVALDETERKNQNRDNVNAPEEQGLLNAETQVEQPMNCTCANHASSVEDKLLIAT